jgi:RNA polymerase sigma-70 factor (ECF subfamily)
VSNFEQTFHAQKALIGALGFKSLKIRYSSIAGLMGAKAKIPLKGDQVNTDFTRIVVNPIGPDLLKRAQQGDADAFAILFETHKMRVYSLCLRMTKNTTEAEDLVQDTFLHVFRKLATFRGDSALSTWLYRIAVNTVLMHFRRMSPHLVSLDDTSRSPGSAKPVRKEYGTQDGRLETSVSRVALTRAISELPEGYRAIYILHEVEGHLHREIATLLGCSVGTSKSQLYKAKLRIRDLLSQSPQHQPKRTRGTEVFAANVPQSRYVRDHWAVRVAPATKIGINTMRAYESPNASSNAA